MSSRLVPYESKTHRILLGGIPLEDGRGDPYFKIAPTGDAYIVEGPGADGHVAFCGTNNDVYEISLTFKGTSKCNDILTAIHIADRKATNGAGVVPLVAEDAGGSSLIQTAECRIMGMAEQTFGVSKGDVTWKLMAVIPPGGFLLGGN